MSSPTFNEFPQKISHFFIYKNEVYPRGGVVRQDNKNIVLLGATVSHIIGLSQVYNDLAITKLTGTDNIPFLPNAELSTIDGLLLYAYKLMFSPYYGEIIKGNKVLAVGVIFSKDVTDKRITYWIYDIENDEIRKIDLIKVDNLVVNYVPIPQNELNKIMYKIFNIEGAKKTLKQYLEHGLFILDSYGE
jgi:hypothetical protein